MRIRHAGTAATLMLALTTLMAPPVEALRQVNPVKQAGEVVNFMDDEYSHEYPWFSTDGRLLLWTRQDKDADCLQGNGDPNRTKGCQRVYVTYIKNWDAVAGVADGVDLPALDVAAPMALAPVNAWADVQSGSTTIKAIATCEEGAQPADLGNRWRYKFSLFMAIGPPSGGKRLWRAHRVLVVVDKASKEITSMGMSAGFIEVTGSDAENKNETEPMLTRDGQYLFWASSAFNKTVAKFMGPVSACTQVAQVAQTYDQLPTSRFAWKSQYLKMNQYESLSRTNYHTVLERPNGNTALIYEACHGQVNCSLNPDSIDCDCEDQKQKLSTSGFTATSGPNLITNFSSGILNGNPRVTHPAISGPRTNNGWLLFFMRGKKIWYTRIKE